MLTVWVATVRHPEKQQNRFSFRFGILACTAPGKQNRFSFRFAILACTVPGKQKRFSFRFAILACTVPGKQPRFSFRFAILALAFAQAGYTRPRELPISELPNFISTNRLGAWASKSKNRRNFENRHLKTRLEFGMFIGARKMSADFMLFGWLVHDGSPASPNRSPGATGGNK